MLKFTFLTESTVGVNVPKIKVLPDYDNDIIVNPGVTETTVYTIAAAESLTLDFFNKTEKDTVVSDDGKIVADSQFRIIDVWCDDIKLEPWFRNEATYVPRYFHGFLESFPDSPAEIKAPYQFNFPGLIKWTWSGNFWDWYFDEKNSREVIHFLDKDPDRVWKFRGSLDPCVDLVTKIKGLLNLQ